MMKHSVGIPECQKTGQYMMKGDYTMNYASPYTPSAGMMPPYLAGRDEIVSKAYKYLLANNFI